jgi:hypothetical protein
MWPFRKLKRRAKDNQVVKPTPPTLTRIETCLSCGDRLKEHGYSAYCDNRDCVRFGLSTCLMISKEVVSKGKKPNILKIVRGD